MSRYQWARPGDINAFFGLMLDNVAVMVLLVGTIAAPGGRTDRFSPAFVMQRMIPGTVVGVVIGDLAYTWMAFQLARRSGRSDVTAMPLGLDTPSTFGVPFLVLLPALAEGQQKWGLDHATAQLYAWHVGAVVLVFCGIFKTILAPFGNAVRRWVPRAGLLGSLAAIALVLIAFLPLPMEIAAIPPVGFLALMIILISLVGGLELPFHLPGALAAVLAGVGGYFLCLLIGRATGWPLVPPLEAGVLAGLHAHVPQPWLVSDLDWWSRVAGAALGYLPVVLPFALATVVGGIDCTESAAAAGDEYDTRSILFAEGVAGFLAGVCGGVIQTTPYIGQPAYKAMGGRAAYTLATALFVGIAGMLGWFTHLFEWLPQAAMFPILVYVGLEISSQSFRATPTRHYPAVVLAVMPALAYLCITVIELVLAGRAPAPTAALVTQTLRGLANGFIITSVLWASALVAIIDGRLLRAASCLGLAGAFALFGIIHSPLQPALIALPGTVMHLLPAEGRYQSPYHWLAAYLVAAGVLIMLHVTRKPSSAPEEAEPASRPGH